MVKIIPHATHSFSCLISFKWEMIFSVFCPNGMARLKPTKSETKKLVFAQCQMATHAKKSSNLNSLTLCINPTLVFNSARIFSPKISDLKIVCWITCAQIRHAQQGTWFQHAQRTQGSKPLRITAGPPSSMPAKKLAQMISSKQHWPLPCQCPHFLGRTCVPHLLG